MRQVTLIAFILSFVPFAQPANQRRLAGASQKFSAESVNNAQLAATLGRGARSAAVLRAQILLDRAHFSPGQIDGAFGSDMQVALTGFQEAHQLTASGRLDRPTWKALLEDSGPVIEVYTITAAEVNGPYEPIPPTMEEQAKLARMGYTSIQEALGEKFHAAPALLTEMNAGKDFGTAGEQILVPKVHERLRTVVARVVVSKTKRTVAGFSGKEELVVQYPATIGSQHDPLPIGDWKIVQILHYPPFNYDPNLFWDAKPTDKSLRLPPGPNNPVGVAWMGLSKEYYGIHGTPEPGEIGHVQSHGCIRLTNWDAEELSYMVRVGTPAILEE